MATFLLVIIYLAFISLGLPRFIAGGSVARDAIGTLMRHLIQRDSFL